MKSIIFNQHQVNHALKNKEGMFRVVCKVQPNSSSQQLMYVACSSERKLIGKNYWAELDKEKLNIKNKTDYFKTPYQVGETIFVKEAFATSLGSLQIEDVKYSADQQNLYGFIGRDDWRNRPAQHMKQEHSRLTLRIKSVKVERLQDISEGDAKAEGAKKIGFDADYGTFHVSSRGDYRTGFIGNWISTHKKPEEKWEANPFCFVYEYEVVR